MRNDPRFSPRAIALYAAGPRAALSITAATGSAPAELLIYDAIGASMWDDSGVAPSAVIAALAKIGPNPVTVRINSPGGDVFDGYAIYNALKAHPGAVSVVVDGIAASAASLIALAGSTVAMHETSMLMIHNAGTVAFGDRNALRETAAILEKLDSQIVAVYTGKTGASAASVQAAMDAETWMTAQDAKAAGYADSIIANIKASPSAAIVPVFDAALYARKLRLREAES